MESDKDLPIATNENEVRVGIVRSQLTKSNYVDIPVESVASHVLPHEGHSIFEYCNNYHPIALLDSSGKQLKTAHSITMTIRYFPAPEEVGNFEVFGFEICT